MVVQAFIQAHGAQFWRVHVYIPHAWPQSVVISIFFSLQSKFEIHPLHFRTLKPTETPTRSGTLLSMLFFKKEKTFKPLVFSSVSQVPIGILYVCELYTYTIRCNMTMCMV